MPENAVLVEGNSAFARKIGLDVRPRGDTVVQVDKARNLTLERLHPLREGVAQAVDDLEQREIDIGQSPSCQIAALAVQQPLEIAEILWHALVPELLGALFGRRLLVLIVERGSERMMGVVDLRYKISDGELELMQPQSSRFRLRRKPVAAAEIEQDIGGLSDHELACLEVWRRKWRRVALLQHPHHRGGAARSAR